MNKANILRLAKKICHRWPSLCHTTVPTYIFQLSCSKCRLSFVFQLPQNLKYKTLTMTAFYLWTLKSFLQYILNGLRLLDRSGFFGQTRWKKCFEVVNERVANRAVQFLLKNNNQVLFKENSGHFSVLWTYIGVFISTLKQNCLMQAFFTDSH